MPPIDRVLSCPPQGVPYHAPHRVFLVVFLIMPSIGCPLLYSLPCPLQGVWPHSQLTDTYTNKYMHHYLDTTWTPPAWTPPGHHLPGHHLDTTWTPPGHHLEPKWFISIRHNGKTKKRQYVLLAHMQVELTDRKMMTKKSKDKLRKDHDIHVD